MKIREEARKLAGELFEVWQVNDIYERIELSFRDIEKKLIENIISQLTKDHEDNSR